MKPVLCNIEDYNEVVDNLRYEWISDVLLNLGIEEEHILNPTPRITREHLLMNKVELYDSSSSGKVDIYFDQELIAQWKDPKRIRIREKDGEEYYQIHLNCWSQIEIDFGKEQ